MAYLLWCSLALPLLASSGVTRWWRHLERHLRASGVQAALLGQHALRALSHTRQAKLPRSRTWTPKFQRQMSSPNTLKNLGSPRPTTLIPIAGMLERAEKLNSLAEDRWRLFP
jgi:hypothetical protein